MARLIQLLSITAALPGFGPCPTEGRPLLGQACIASGEPLPDPAAFSKRLSDVMRQALAA